MCPHTTIYVSSYYFICVLILLYMCSHTSMCVLCIPHCTLCYEQYEHMTCPHNSMSIWRVRILLHHVSSWWRMLMYADVSWRMLTYADVCWRMLTYADGCRRILMYADVCWRMLTNSGMYARSGVLLGHARYAARRMLTYADVCWRMLTYADVCEVRWASGTCPARRKHLTTRPGNLTYKHLTATAA
jgi:hypothetical protein